MGSFSFIEARLSDIEKELKALNDKKAFMSDSIPPKVLKDNSYICVEPLKRIINNGILNSDFYDGLKCADLIPAHKTDDTTKKKN